MARFFGNNQRIGSGLSLRGVDVELNRERPKTGGLPRLDGLCRRPRKAGMREPDSSCRDHPGVELVFEISCLDPWIGSRVGS